MKIGGNNSFFSKENIKNEAKMAGASGLLSAGLTLAVNKGQNPKQAAMVGLFAAGVSVAIGAVQKAIVMHKSNAAAENNSSNAENNLGVSHYHNG